VLYVAEMAPRIPDEAVLDLANREETPLLTTDRDFGELAFRQGRLHSGVVLIRLSSLSTQAKADTVAAAINEHIAEYPEAFAIVTPSAVRFRRSLR
jgi:predicted nuclease of predicted toxin-antitoxin system